MPQPWIAYVATFTILRTLVQVGFGTNEFPGLWYAFGGSLHFGIFCCFLQWGLFKRLRVQSPTVSLSLATGLLIGIVASLGIFALYYLFQRYFNVSYTFPLAVMRSSIYIWYIATSYIVPAIVSGLVMMVLMTKSRQRAR